MNPFPTPSGSPEPSGQLQFPYNVLALLREERDKLIKDRNTQKGRIKICEKEEARWKQNRMAYRNNLKNININIIEANSKIKEELDRMDDLAEEDI
tara:strand:- start:657 stop:944 length:288 start_codon:yes stop_codon:yes gene_type:complete